MDDTAAGRHKLKVAGVEAATIAFDVFVLYTASQQVGDSFLTTVRMVRETGRRRNVEMVQHQKGCEVAELGGANGAANHGTSTLRLFSGEEDFLNTASRHVSVC